MLNMTSAQRVPELSFGRAIKNSDIEDTDRNFYQVSSENENNSSPAIIFSTESKMSSGMLP